MAILLRSDRLIETMLSASHLVEKMHFGMAVLVDEPTELWQFPSWGSSIRATSGDVCFTVEGQLIIPGDILEIHDAGGSEWAITMGRVIFIGRDYRSDASTQGGICVTVQPVVDWHHPWVRGIRNISDSENELLIIEGRNHEITPTELMRHSSIYIDREYDDESDETNEVIPDGRYIRRVLNYDTSEIRLVCRLHPTRGKLEVSYFGREHVEQFFGNRHTSLPYLLFIDDFGVHSNMYRALKAFYIVPANLSYEERRKIANVFTLTLGPHDAAIEGSQELQSNGRHGSPTEPHGIHVCTGCYDTVHEILPGRSLGLYPPRINGGVGFCQ